MICPLDACKVCTACYHDRHEQCRGEVQCPDTFETSTCRCCGTKAGLDRGPER